MCIYTYLDICLSLMCCCIGNWVGWRSTMLINVMRPIRSKVIVFHSICCALVPLCMWYVKVTCRSLYCFIGNNIRLGSSWANMEWYTFTYTSSPFCLDHLQARLVYYLMNIHIRQRCIYLCRVSFFFALNSSLAWKYA